MSNTASTKATASTCEQRDDLGALEYGTRPPVREDERHSVLSARSDVNEVHRQAIDLCHQAAMMVSFGAKTGHTNGGDGGVEAPVMNWGKAFRRACCSVQL